MSLNTGVSAQFADLDTKSVTIVEYVWIGGSGTDLRSKAKVVQGSVTKVEQLSLWNFDGSSTGQAPGHDSEVILKPVRIFKDPFRGGHHVLALCETYKPEGQGVITPLSHLPTEGTYGVTGNNTRFHALKIFDNPKVKEAKPWFGIEQEYILFKADGVTPIGFPEGGVAHAQGPYYCSAGTGKSIGRDVAEAHLAACVHAGIRISGINGEVFPGQWEYQIGPCEGIDSGDEMWMSRYLLERVCEKFGVILSIQPKPIKGDWNGSGAHTNYSTAPMRDPDCVYEYRPSFAPYSGATLKGGFAKIVEAIERMGAPGKPAEHIAVYGPGFKERLTGAHETSRYDQFSYGVANRGASIRIPREAEYNGYGYYEDRRPSAAMDPYQVTAKIAETTILSE
jgi:glutamine synthetase